MARVANGGPPSMAESTTRSRYDEAYRSWKDDPDAFWSRAAQRIDWTVAPQAVFDPKRGVYGRWFPDGELNTCWNAVDRHVGAGRGAQPAIIWDSPVTGRKATIT